MMRRISRATLRISTSAHWEPRISMKWRRARPLAVTKIMVSVGLGRAGRAAWRGRVGGARGELGVGEAGAVADEFVGEGAGDAGDDEVPDGVLEDGAVLLSDDVGEVVGVGLAALAEGGGAEAAAGLGELLAADLGVGLPGHAVLVEEAVDLGAVDVLAADEVDLGFADYVHD